MGVSDRSLQAPLTLEAKIASDFSLVRAILAFAGFVSALRGRFPCGNRPLSFKGNAAGVYSTSPATFSAR